MKFIIAPDSFKGSLSAEQFCQVAENTLRSQWPDSTIVSMPLADGGEGTLDCINTALKGEIKTLEVTGPFFYQKVTAKVGFFNEGKTAVVESAMAMGLPMVGENKNPELTNTYGVGQMIDFALKQGAKKIILALGGSSTNDCGAGMLCALGAKFLDKNGKTFIPTGGTLKEIVSADLTSMNPQVFQTEIVAMCDVTNPLCGGNGCSHIFGPQKGADSQMVLRLDEGCRHFSQILQLVLQSQSDFAEVPGSGAAGGLGFACVSALRGKLQSGIEIILQLYNFSQQLDGCSHIFTGEGSFDYQSLMGKTIGGIISASKQHNPSVPITIFCGRSTVSTFQSPVQTIVEISKNVPLDYAMTHSPELLEIAIKNWAKS